MKGAREFAELFETGQYGKLFIETGSHARGKIFRIYVLPEGAKVKYTMELYEIKGVVEVYGIVGGQPGWTEQYDWIHTGKWCADFGKLVGERKKEIQNSNNKDTILSEEKQQNEKKRVAELLDKY